MARTPGWISMDHSRRYGLPEIAQAAANGTHKFDYYCLVEEAFKRLYDFSYLADHPLAALQLVQVRLVSCDQVAITHLERGKAVCAVLEEVLQKLRPEGLEPRAQEIPTRAWYPYLILSETYVNGQMQRQVMNRLYIGEGTFHRTRRSALRSVARALWELEEQVQAAQQWLRPERPGESPLVRFPSSLAKGRKTHQAPSA